MQETTKPTEAVMAELIPVRDGPANGHSRVTACECWKLAAISITQAQQGELNAFVAHLLSGKPVLG